MKYAMLLCDGAPGEPSSMVTLLALEDFEDVEERV